jgi:hypothetical protein
MLFLPGLSYASRHPKLFRICVGPLSDGEGKNPTFVSWLDRAESGMTALVERGAEAACRVRAGNSADDSLIKVIAK